MGRAADAPPEMTPRLPPARTEISRSLSDTLTILELNKTSLAQCLADLMASSPSLLRATHYRLELVCQREAAGQHQSQLLFLGLPKQRSLTCLLYPQMLAMTVP